MKYDYFFIQNIYNDEECQELRQHIESLAIALDRAVYVVVLLLLIAAGLWAGLNAVKLSSLTSAAFTSSQ